MAVETMNLKERNKYLRLMKERYQKANRRHKGQLLDEMGTMTGLHRKYLVARMNGPGPYRRCNASHGIGISPQSD